MEIIKIKRSSIRKNPDAGRTSYDYPAGTTVTGTIKGVIPNWLKDQILVTSTMMIMGDDPEIEFHVIGPIDIDLIKRITKIKGASISVEYHYNHFESMFPEPEYKYDYYNPL